MTLPAGLVDHISGDDATFVLDKSNGFLVFANAYNSVAFIDGNQDAVSFNWRDEHLDNNDRVADMGQGTTVSVGFGNLLASYGPLPYQNLQLFDFGHDKTGSIDVWGRSFWLSSDGHGGTDVWYPNGKLDVVGDAHLTASQVHLNLIT